MAEVSLMVWALIAAVSDLRRRRLPNVLTLGGLAGGIAIVLVSGQTAMGDDSASAWQGLGLGLLLTLPAYPLHLLGAGDVKFAAAIGMLAGLTYFMFAYILAAALCLLLLVTVRCWALFPNPPLRCPAPVSAAFSGKGRNVPFGAALGIALAAATAGRLAGYPL